MATPCTTVECDRLMTAQNIEGPSVYSLFLLRTNFPVHYLDENIENNCAGLGGGGGGGGRRGELTEACLGWYNKTLLQQFSVETVDNRSVVFGIIIIIIIIIIKKCYIGKIQSNYPFQSSLLPAKKVDLPNQLKSIFFPKDHKNTNQPI